MKYIRGIYDWVLSWSEKPGGPSALGAMSAAEASFFPIPPDVLLIPLALGNREKAIWFATICSVCSIMGAVVGYGIGHFIWWAEPGQFTGFAQFFFDHIPGFTIAAFSKIQVQYDQWDFWIIFTAGFTPIPFKLFTISAGAFEIDFAAFVLASLVGRSARFFLVSGLIKKYGEPIHAFINNYFNILALAFTILLFGGFLMVKVLF
ncbi:MAG: YqaA family protein [Candidatus Marinimicrobia bacterium]|nr:YqaA family protein [Candidatus Neomarinimicrobiota bacterium]